MGLAGSKIRYRRSSLPSSASLSTQPEAIVNPTVTENFDEVVLKGQAFIREMPLDNFLDDYCAELKVALDLKDVDFHTRLYPDKNKSIDIKLFYFLIRLQEMCDEGQLIEEQERKIKSLLNVLFITLADEQYYYQAMVDLENHLLFLNEQQALTLSLRDGFFKILIPVQNNREMYDLPSKEIDKLSRLLDPSSGNIPGDIPPLCRSNTSRLEAALLRENENLVSKNEPVVENIPHKEIEFKCTLNPDDNLQSKSDVNFRSNPDVYMQKYEISAEEVQRLQDTNKKLKDLQKIFADYEIKLQKSWIYNGKAVKLKDNKDFLDILDNKNPDTSEHRLEKVIGMLQNKKIVDRLSGNRKNCATSFANHVERGVAQLCSRFGIMRTINEEEKKSNGKLAIEKARKALGLEDSDSQNRSAVLS